MSMSNEGDVSMLKRVCSIILQARRSSSPDYGNTHGTALSISVCFAVFATQALIAGRGRLAYHQEACSFQQD